MSTEGPKPTGRRSEVSLTGALMPWKQGQPAFLSVPGSDALYLPIFSAQDKLEGMMACVHTPYQSVKQIQDEADFLSSIPTDIKIMFDPYFTPEGKVRWTELLRD
jgi:hypothetical protein